MVLTWFFRQIFDIIYLFFFIKSTQKWLYFNIYLYMRVVWQFDDSW